MKHLLALVLALVVGAGCAQSDAERLDKVEVEGTTCVVVRDGLARVKFIDCDWEVDR